MQKQPLDWKLKGYGDYPNYGYPPAGTQAETDYIEGWNLAQRESANSDDHEWPFGRETFFAHY
jgi:hypothetical protein